MIKVSIIVPVYNAEKYIEKCVKSIVNQTLKEIEIILVDDDSKDSSLKICNEFAKEDSRIKVIHKENEGAGISRNVGIKYAKGEYIAFLDSDDYIDETMYEKLYNEAIQKNVQACFCGYNKVENGKISKVNHIDKMKYDKNKILEESIPYICSSGKGNIIKGAIAVWHGIYSRDIIEKENISFKNEREFFSEDTIFNLQFFLCSDSIAFVDEYLYYQNVIKNSLSHSRNILSLDMIKNFYYFIKEKIENIEDDKIDKNKCINLLGARAFNEYKVRIIKTLKFEPDRKKVKENLEVICKNDLFKELINNKSLQLYFENKDKYFIFLIKNKLYFILRIIYRFLKLMRNE